MHPSIRRPVVLLCWLLALVAGCDARTQLGAALAGDEVAFATWVVDRLAAGDRAAVEARFDRSALDAPARVRLSEVAATFPVGAPRHVGLTGWTVHKAIGGPTEWEIEMTSRYPDADVVTRVGYRKVGDRRDLVHIRVALERSAVARGIDPREGG